MPTNRQRWRTSLSHTGGRRVRNAYGQRAADGPVTATEYLEDGSPNARSAITVGMRAAGGCPSFLLVPTSPSPPSVPSRRHCLRDPLLLPHACHCLMSCSPAGRRRFAFLVRSPGWPSWQARMLVLNGRFDEALGHPAAAWAATIPTRSMCCSSPAGMAAIGAAEARDDDEAARAMLLDGAIAALPRHPHRPAGADTGAAGARAGLLPQGRGRSGAAPLRGRARRRAGAGGRQRPAASSTEIRARERWRFNLPASRSRPTATSAAASVRAHHLHPCRHRQSALPPRRGGLTTSGIGVSVWGGGGVPGAAERADLAAARRRGALAAGV